MRRRAFLAAAGGAASLAAGCLGPDLAPVLDLDVSVRAGPVVAGDSLYFTTERGTGDAATTRTDTAASNGDLVAVDLQTGDVTRPVRDARAGHAPAVAGGEVALCGRACRLHAIGSGLVWERALPGGRYAADRPPVVRDGQVAVGLDSGAFVALDRASGETLWTARPGADAPVGWARAGDRTVVTTADGTAAMLDPADGRVLATRQFDEPLLPSALGGDVVLVGQRTRLVGPDLTTEWVYAADGDVVRGPVRADSLLYLAGYRENYRESELAAVDAATGREVWSTDFRGGAVGPPVVFEGGSVTVGTAVAGNLVQFTAEGHVVRRVHLDGRLAGPLRRFGGRLLALTENGALYVVE